MKFDIRKKLVTLAVASAVSGGAMLMAAPAQAMNVSQNGIGEVVLFPYYTVRNGFDTVFTVTNTTDKTAILKIRWREALNSREVRDFNVILSPYDHWSGAVTATTSGAMVRTYDKSCTSPMLTGMTTTAARAAAGAKGEVEFTNALFTGGFADGGPAEMDRVKEGYFEVFLMGLSSRSTSDSNNTLEYGAKHVGGVPRDCAAVDALFLNPATINTYVNAPENVLKATMFLLNTSNGTAIDAKPTHIEDFQNTDPIVYAPSDLYPDLSNGEASSQALFLDDGVGMLAPAADSVTTVSSLLMAASVINEFATGGVANTSWVLTFPTKHHYTDGVGPLDPFSERFQTGSNGQSCDTIGMTLFNREEGQVVSVDNTQFSPYNPSITTVSLCHEANVIDFNTTTGLFGVPAASNVNHRNRLSVDTSGVGSAGWARLTFTEAPAATDGLNGQVGLPVIGFGAQLRTSGDLTVNYGSAVDHTYVRGYTTP